MILKQDEDSVTITLNGVSIKIDEENRHRLISFLLKGKYKGMNVSGICKSVILEEDFLYEE